MRPWDKVFTAAAILLASTTLAAAPPKRSDIPRLPGETIEVSIVNVDVFVTDKGGNRIHGLTKDDFLVTVDGKPQAVTNFAEYAAAVGADQVTATGGGAGAAVAPPQKRSIIVYMEDFFLPPFRKEPVYAAVKKFLHETVRPGDSAMIVTWRDRLRVRHDFTDDVAALEHTLDTIYEESEGPYGRSPEVTKARSRDIALNSFVNGSLRDESSVTTFGGRVQPGPEDMVGGGGRVSARFVYAQIKSKVSALRALMNGISGVEGKKVLLMATHRFSDIAGAEYLTASPRGVQQFRSEFGTEGLVDSLMDAANSNNVTIYPVYPEGLGTSGLPRADVSQLSGANLAAFDYVLLNNETPVLARIARQTGGMSAWGAENIVELLPRVEADFDSYYSLAYKATESGEDRGHKIVVRAKDPGYVVRTRREVVEKSDDTKMKDRVVANLFQPAAGSVIGIRVETGTRQRRGDHTTIPLSIKIPIKALTTVPRGKVTAGAFSVYIAWGGALGETTGDVTRRTQPFTIPVGELNKVKDGELTYDIELIVDDATQRVSVGVLDEVSKEYGVSRLDLSASSSVAGAFRPPAVGGLKPAATE